MPEYKLSDEQWCLMDLLMRSRAKGIHKLNRMELLNNNNLPQGVLLKLTWAALSMPETLVVWHNQHDFSITDAGISLFNLRFGKDARPAAPTQIADGVICLPGPGDIAH